MASAASDILQSELPRLPGLLRQPVALWQDRLTAERPEALAVFDGRADDARALLRLVARSEFAAATLLAEWDWFAAALAADELATLPGEQQLVRPLQLALADATDTAGAQRALRRFRNQRLLQILWCESRKDPPLPAVLESLSALADALLEAAIELAGRQITARFGAACDAAGQAAPLIVLAMGKLGGRELNFSSDIDLIFLHAGQGETDGPRHISAEEYFTRLARSAVALLDEVTADGFVYRVDTRLRPFGDSGPPVVSVAALEAYLLQHGRGWERYAYVKARVPGPARDSAVADELMREVISPFVYRRYLDYGVFESLRDMKALIAAEVQKRELADDIKLGPGGIREIEFIVQSLQLVRGGADLRLRGGNLLEILPRLVAGGGLSREAATALSSSYVFLRRFENALQALRDQQTHKSPASDADRARLALALDFADWAALHAELRRQREIVSRQFAAVAFRAAGEPGHSELYRGLAGLWRAGAAVEDWSALLTANEFHEPAELAAAIHRFGAVRALRRIDGTAGKRLAKFMPALLSRLRERRRPALVFERVIQLVQQILQRSAYVALLNENPAVLGRLVALCESSAYLAAEIARYPLLLDEMLDPRLFRAELSSDDMRADLQQRVSRLGEHDSEQAVEALAQFQRATLFRIAVADFSGSVPIMKVSDKLTELAEIVLREALAIAWQDLTGKHGEPWIDAPPGRRKAGFGVIAYGKLGGMELSYASDLDLIFLHDAGAGAQQTDGGKPLANSVFFVRLVGRLVHFLTTQTASGALYEVDTRLRPSGRAGLLVISVEAFEKYQEDNAWTWEHQALLRARPVAGDAVVAREFERVRAETLRHRVHRERLRDDVLSMRSRMRRELDRGRDAQFDLKQGPGGIGDIEFMVQYLVLRHADSQPAVIHYTDIVRQLGTLAAAGCLDAADAERLQQAYKAYRQRLHRLALDERPPLIGGSEFPDERAFVVDAWGRIFDD